MKWPSDIESTNDSEFIKANMDLLNYGTSVIVVRKDRESLRASHVPISSVMYSTDQRSKYV